MIVLSLYKNVITHDTLGFVDLYLFMLKVLELHQLFFDKLTDKAVLSFKTIDNPYKTMKLIRNKTKTTTV